jgi:hypothetical protein
VRCGNLGSRVSAKGPPDEYACQLRKAHPDQASHVPCRHTHYRTHYSALGHCAPASAAGPVRIRSVCREHLRLVANIATPPSRDLAGEHGAAAPGDVSDGLTQFGCALCSSRSQAVRPAPWAAKGRERAAYPTAPPESSARFTRLRCPSSEAREAAAEATRGPDTGAVAPRGGTRAEV